MATDSFTYSNGDLATVSSGAWVTVGGNGMTVGSNQITNGVNNQDSGAFWATAFTTTHFSEATISTTGTGTYQDLEVSTRGNTVGPDYYIASVGNSGTGVEFYLRQGGTFTSMGAAVAYTGSHICHLESSGSNHTCLVDAVSVRTWTDATLNANTRIGIAGFTQAVGNVTLDNWQGGDLGAGGASDFSGTILVLPRKVILQSYEW